MIYVRRTVVSPWVKAHGAAMPAPWGPPVISKSRGSNVRVPGSYVFIYQKLTGSSKLDLFAFDKVHFPKPILILNRPIKS